MSNVIRLDQVAFDAGTQIRAAIDQHVVSDYAEAMTNGATFPPIVLFHDGNQHYLADGFHRFMAAQRLEFREIAADIRPGTKDDALWFALGANQVNGHRLTEADKRHALALAFHVWPTRSARQVAEHVGCSSTYATRIRDEVQTSLHPVERVTGSDGRSYPATREARAQTRQHAEKLLRGGKTVAEVRAEVGIGRDSALQIQREIGALDKSIDGVQKRRERMREMATKGYTSRQIASELGLSFEGCRNTMKRDGIDVPADRAVGKTKRHDANRIVERIVMDAENIIEGFNLIEFDELDAARLPEWIASLSASRDKLMAFIRRLMKERQNNGEAA